MANKSKKKNWDDVKMVISALSVATTLAMWNIFSAGNNQKESSQVQVIEATPEPTVFVQPTPTATQPPFSGIILLGGEAPKPRVVVVRSSGGGGGGGGGSGGGGGGGAVTTTASS